jgi:hypothetical protein
MVLIAILGVVLLFFAVTFSLFVFKCIKIDKVIAAKTETVNEFVQKSKMPLTEGSISFLMDERNKLKSAHSRLKLALTSPLTEEIPPENIDSLQFKERLIQAQKNLREEAKEASLSLPESLGFTKYETELSEPKEIPGLWKRLRIMEELIYIMSLSGVTSLDEINFVGDDLKKEERTPVYDEITASFKITSTYSELVDFLYRLRVSPFIFVVDDLDITKAKDELDKDEAAESMVQASFQVKAEIIR